MKTAVNIPALSAKHGISRLPDMLLNQTIQPEILAIDSGSTEGMLYWMPAVVNRL